MKQLLRTRKFTFLFLTWLFIFLLAEGGARIGIRMFGWDNFYQFEYGDKPYISYYKAPNPKQTHGIKYGIRAGTDRYGFRVDSNDDPNRDLTEKSDQEYRIFLLGGSTVDGRFLSDVDDVLSSRLENLLQEKFPQRDIEVINAGNSGFFSVQELSLYIYYIGHTLRPDHIIFFNGSNDFANWLSTDLSEIPGLEGNIHSRGVEFYATASESNGWTSIDESIRHVANYLKTVYYFREGVLSLIDVINDNNADNNSKEQQELDTQEHWIQRHIDRYFYNIQTSLKLGDSVTYVTYILQPTLLPETPVSPEEQEFMKGPKANVRVPKWHGYDYFENKQRFYNRLRKVFRELSLKNTCYAKAVDLSHLFTDKDREYSVFGDYVHYLPKGREIISRAIFDVTFLQVKHHIESEQYGKSCG